MPLSARMTSDSPEERNIMPLPPQRGGPLTLRRAGRRKDGRFVLSTFNNPRRPSLLCPSG